MPHFTFPNALASVATGDQFSRLRAAHPRLNLLPMSAGRVRRLAASQEAARVLLEQLEEAGGRMVASPAVTAADHGGARATLDRLYTLAAMRLLADDPWPYVAAAVEQLMTTARLAQWANANTTDFLGAAEYIHAVCFGYDTLHDVLTGAQRDEVAEAILRKGLEPARVALACLPWWHRDTCNWNVVCNGAIVLATLAVAERYPTLCRQLFAAAMSGLPNAVATLCPDGGWPEGPGYWAFTMRYLTPLVSALEGSIGTAFSLDALSGVAHAPSFRLHTAGPTGRFFNFADSYEEAPSDGTVFFWARRANLPAWSAIMRQSIERGAKPGYFGGAARALAWYDETGTEADVARMPLSARFIHHHVAAFRTSWTDSAAMYLACKGGDIQEPHAHADLGSFVLDHGGERFVTDLGPDHYDLPGFWNGRPNTDGGRWRLLRTGTHGHSTLIVNGRGQFPLAKAEMTEFVALREGRAGGCTIDLTQAYEPAGLSRAVREFGFDAEKGAVTVVDRVESKGAAKVQWQAITAATLEGDVLTLNGKRMRISATLRREGKAEVPLAVVAEDLVTDPGGMDVAGLRRVLVVAEVEGAGEIEVRFTRV